MLKDFVGEKMDMQYNKILKRHADKDEWDRAGWGLLVIAMIWIAIGIANYRPFLSIIGLFVLFTWMFVLRIEKAFQ